jgi:sec-independent protein translocase protein TatB
MFDIGWSELLLIGIVALVAIGPKELPGAIYQLGKWVRRARVLASEARYHVDELMRQAELDEIRKEATGGSLDFDRLVKDTIDPDHKLRETFSEETSGATGHPGSPPEMTEEEEIEAEAKVAALPPPSETAMPDAPAPAEPVVSPAPVGEPVPVSVPPTTDKTA